MDNPSGSNVSNGGHLKLLRWMLILAQAITVLITWDLWQARTWPPMLPAVPLPPVGMGWWILASLFLIAMLPAVGLVFHAAVLGVAMLADQSRIQPEIISHVFLMLATLPPAWCRMIGRVHLAAMWFYAGLSKLLSPWFGRNLCWLLLRKLIPGATQDQAVVFGTLIAITELSVGLLVIPLRTRRAAAYVAAGMHLAILVILSPAGLNLNAAVWPWNVVLAMAAVVFFAQWKDSAVREFRLMPKPAQVGAAFLLISPIGHYFGVLDAYLSHALYSNHTPVAIIVSADGKQREIASETMGAINAPLGPEHRLFDAYFAKVAKPGDRMIVTDPRWWFRHEARRVVTYDDLQH